MTGRANKNQINCVNSYSTVQCSSKLCLWKLKLSRGFGKGGGRACRDATDSNHDEGNHEGGEKNLRRKEKLRALVCTAPTQGTSNTSTVIRGVDSTWRLDAGDKKPDYPCRAVYCVLNSTVFRSLG